MPSMETGPLDLMEISSSHNQIVTSHHLQEMMGGYPMEQQKHQQQEQEQEQERKMKPPQSEQPLHCPRCDSTNTKFCYYNNYSLTQPRYFCKGCRRYWTQGGTLRNVPVGGGCRKNKRSPSSSSKIKGTSSPTDQALTTTSSNPLYLTHPPPLSYDPSDLTLSFTCLQSHDHFLLPNPNPNTAPAPAPTYLPSGTGLLDILRNGFIDSTTTTTTVAPSHFQNYYYGYGPYGGNTGESVIGEEIVMPFDGSSIASQVGSCKGVDGGENKPLMGLPWQLGSGDGGEYWNGVGSANWHGLINSSLM